MIGSRVRRLLSFHRKAGIVLLYHRVEALNSDPQLLAVQPDVFDAHLSMLRRHTTVLSLREMMDLAQRGRLPKRAVAVTFDDGYADNLRHAGTILSRHDVPATLFAVSGVVSQQTEFWWDTLERALLGSKGKASLELEMGGNVSRWDLDGEPAEFPGWNVLSAADPTPRHRVYRELMPLVKAMAPSLRRSFLRDLLRQVGVDEGPVDSTRPLTEDELRQLAHGGLVEIGAHSVSHPKLSSLEPARQLEEMKLSKEALESILGRQVSTFAYPYGSQDDYSTETARLAGEAGFDCACANFPGLVGRGVDRMQVPRLLVRNVQAATLEQALEHAFAGQF